MSLTREQEEILDLRDRIYELEEELLQIKKSMRATPDFPASWGLSPAQQRALTAFLRAPNGFVSKELLLSTIALKSDPSPLMVGVAICYLRKKLKRLGVEIITNRANGYEMPATSRSLLKHALSSSEFPN